MNIKLLLSFYLFFVIHELGHIVVALIFKLRLYKLKLNLFGVNLQVETNNLSYEGKLILYFAGPLTNIVISFIALKFKNYTIHYINMVLGLFNLVPVYPLDGGNMLKTVLELFFKERKLYIIILTINIILLILTTICFIKSLSIFYLALFYHAFCGIFEHKKLIEYENIKTNYRKKFRME